MRKLSEGSPELPSAEESGLEFAKGMGITETGAEALQALRALPMEQVNGDMSMVALVTKPPTYAGGPIIDGETVMTTPGEVLRRGEAAKVPLIIGTTGQDLPVIFPPDRANPPSYFGTDAETAGALYNPGGQLPTPALTAAVAVDLTMQEPARFAARQMTAAGNPVWLYRFSYVAESLRPESAGAEHASELPYLFNTLDARFGNDATEKDRAMALATHTYFASFGKSGDPNGTGLPAWPTYDPAKPDLMNFTLDNGPMMEADPWKERLDLVERASERETPA
jgi:para-nitrobenzyl esterase